MSFDEIADLLVKDLVKKEITLHMLVHILFGLMVN